MRLRSILWIIIIVASMLLISACGGLAGEPEIVGQMPTQVAPVSVAVEPPNTQPDLALGAQIFSANCVRCHGETGAGDGEFVQSGQITDIPNFTDPEQHAGRTATEYYTMVTNGNLANLMPPFSGTLSEQERWSVANYVMTLSDTELSESAVELPIATEEAEATAETVETETTTPDTGESEILVDTGTISGSVLQGTLGGTIPESATITLTIVEITGAQTILTTPLNSDASYEFIDVPIIPEAGYLVSMDYSNGTFNSEFTSLTAASPNINLNITIYDTTDDDSVIRINMVLSQIDVIDENTLQIWQLISVSNISDKLYVYTDNRGESVSVKVPAPSGVRLSPDIDISRFVFNDNAVYDTQPVVPGREHSFHLLYTVPFNDTLDFSQSFPYEFMGPYEVYVDSSQLQLSGEGWQTLDTPQDIQGVSYRGIVKVNGFPANELVAFTIKQSGFVINRQWLGYGVIAVGLILILVAGIFYWRASDAPSEIPESGDDIQGLMKQIATLDDQYQKGSIAKSDYEKQRKGLKDKVAVLMKASSK